MPPDAAVADAAGSISPAIPLDPSYVLAWSDEFDKDLSKWNDHEPWQSSPGSSGYGNCWFPIPAGDLAEVSNGLLQLKLRVCANPDNAPMCGVEITTRGKYESFVHGYIEGRMKNPGGADAWPAFWIMGNVTWPSGGEIDIYEFVNNGSDNGIPFFTVHWGGASCSSNHCSKGYTWPATLPTYDTQFHTWGLLRTPDELEVYIDGTLWSKITRSEVQTVGGDYDVLFNNEMHIRLDVTSGGSWADDPSLPPAEGELIVDYIRVWEKQP